MTRGQYPDGEGKNGTKIKSLLNSVNPHLTKGSRNQFSETTETECLSSSGEWYSRSVETYYVQLEEGNETPFSYVTSQPLYLLLLFIKLKIVTKRRFLNDTVSSSRILIDSYT